MRTRAGILFRARRNGRGRRPIALRQFPSYPRPIAILHVIIYKMMRLVERAINALGIETPAERDMWDSRVELLRDTVGVNYFNEGFQEQLEAEVGQLRDAGINKSPSALEIYAEERIRVRALCAARCAVPAAGVDVSQLQEMGFDTGRRGKERLFGPLQVVGFPDGWQMEPISRRAEVVNTSHAVVRDESGIYRLNVFYRRSAAGATLKARSHIVSPY